MIDTNQTIWLVQNCGEIIGKLVDSKILTADEARMMLGLAPLAPNRTIGYDAFHETDDDA
jgi:hypothetical protein